MDAQENKRIKVKDRDKNLKSLWKKHFDFIILLFCSSEGDLHHFFPS